MTKTFRPLLAVHCLLLCQFLLLGNPARGTEPEESRESWDRPFLWVIQGAVPSYLFGTIHVSDERLSEFPPSVIEALDSSDGVFTEIAFSAMGSALSGSLLTGRHGIKDLLPPMLYQRVNRYLERRSMSLMAFERFKIWNLATTLGLLDRMRENNAQQGLDLRVWGRALAADKEIGGVESVHEQLEVFDGLSLGEQIDFLISTMDTLEQAESDGVELLDELFDVFVRGDLDGLQAMMEQQYDLEDSLDAKLLDRLITRRNRRMADRIAKKIRGNPEKSYFVAMGAAHFLPKGGVQVLLREMGFRIERVQ